MTYSHEQKYVLVAERDCNERDPDPRMIVFEQYLDQGAGSLTQVKEFQKRLGNRYGKTRIARLEYIEDWQGDDQNETA